MATVEHLAAGHLGVGLVGPADQAAPAFGSLLSCLADAGRLPAVVHCPGGKDRTGLTIALPPAAAPRVPEVVEAFTRLGIGRPAAEALMSTPRWAMARPLRELTLREP